VTLSWSQYAFIDAILASSSNVIVLMMSMRIPLPPKSRGQRPVKRRLVSERAKREHLGLSLDVLDRAVEAADRLTADVHLSPSALGMAATLHGRTQRSGEILPGGDR